MLKKIFILALLISLIFPFEVNQIDAASTTLSKTVEFFIGQSNTVHSVNNEQFSFYFNNVNLPETPTIKSAIVEIDGISYNNSGNQIINIDLKPGIDAAGLGKDYIIGGTAKPKPFIIKYDAWQNGAGPVSNIVFSNTVYDYTLYLKGSSEGGAISFSIASAKLILTYDSSSSGANFLKTNKFFISQEKDPVLSNTETKRDFSITIPESSPEARSVFIEVSGVAKGTGAANTIQLSVVKEGLPVYNTYNIDLSALAANSKFVARYDMTSLFGPADYPISNYSLYIKNSFDTYLLNAKLIATYKYSTNTGGLPIKGELISSTFDTGVAGGAAFNSLIWKGSSNGGKVRMQIATSDNAAGPWDPDLDFKGPSCSGGASDVYLMDSPGEPVEIMCPEINNNKKFFRYKVILCSNDCNSAGDFNPEVTEVVVNWSR